MGSFWQRNRCGRLWWTSSCVWYWRGEQAWLSFSPSSFWLVVYFFYIIIPLVFCLIGHSKLRCHETTSGPVLCARWQRSTRTGMMQRSWQLSAWLPDLVAMYATSKGPVLCLLKLTQEKDMMTTWLEKKMKEVWTSLDFLHFLICTTLPSQLAVLSPVFLGITRATGLPTSDANMKPYSQTQNSPPFFNQMP